MSRPMMILAEAPQPGQKVSPISEPNVARGRPKHRPGVRPTWHRDGLVAATPITGLRPCQRPIIAVIGAAADMRCARPVQLRCSVCVYHLETSRGPN